ncbi:MAG: hypothetical protein GF317_01375 [Candidatus Lokiarchaeota archaeon]|nr:hypothetical protein [Candidatus Lokiarchaeota archaeon]
MGNLNTKNGTYFLIEDIDYGIKNLNNISNNEFQKECLLEENLAINIEHFQISYKYKFNGVLRTITKNYTYTLLQKKFTLYRFERYILIIKFSQESINLSFID